MAPHSEQQFSRIQVIPLTPRLGAEIKGVDIRDNLDDDVIAEIRAAVLKHKIVIFRDQDITTTQHAAFARRFGEPDVHPSTPRDQPHPEVLYLRNGPNSKASADIWHTDGSWRAEPSWGTVLRSRIVPPAGGDTLFADMGAALEGLSPALKSWISSLTAVHDMAVGFAGRTDMSKEQMNALYPPQEHPVVATHPETGERLLYVNVAFASHIKDLNPVESDWLLRHLCAQVNAPEYQYRLHWEPNIVAFWDNWSVQHYATFDYYPEIREMERIALAGARSFAQAQKSPRGS